MARAITKFNSKKNSKLQLIHSYWNLEFNYQLHIAIEIDF